MLWRICILIQFTFRITVAKHNSSGGHGSTTGTVLLQVPFLQSLIMRWAERTGYDVSRQPSERGLTHAVIQAAEAARGGRPPSAPPALPRASREEMEVGSNTSTLPCFL